MEQQDQETSIEVREISVRVPPVVQMFPGLKMEPCRGSSNGYPKYIHTYQGRRKKGGCHVKYLEDYRIG